MIADTRDRLLDAATGLFADAGYRGASVRRICDLANANPGAVSYHFGGKRQLYRAVLRRAGTLLSHPRAAVPDDGDEPPAEDLVEHVELILDRIIEHPDATRVLLRDLVDGGCVAV